MLFLFTYLKIGIWGLIYKIKPNDITYDIIVNNIKRSGPVLIKLIQWTLPKIEYLHDINKNSKDNTWFYKLEDVYENCEYHSLKYTEKTYKNMFSKDIYEDYEKIEPISSGSIGQVYKITDYKNNIYALKIVHPNIESQLLFFNCLIHLIAWIKPFHDILLYYFPFDLRSFIKDFKIQKNFINEANNNIHFSTVYKDNPYIIIPELKCISKDIIIMSYEEGNIYNQNDHSDYINYKIISLLKLFNKNNESIYHFMHSDLHKGNWKTRVSKSDVKLVIYDYGFCYKLPKSITENLIFLNHTMMDCIIQEYAQNKIDIDSLTKVAEVFTNWEISTDIIYEEIDDLLNNKKMKCSDAIFFLKVILNICRKSKTYVDANILAMIIGHNQVSHLYKLAFNDNFKENDKDYNERYYYFQYFSDLINFCQTNNIFLDYMDYLKNEMTKVKQQKNIKFDSLFLKNDLIENNSLIKSICIPDDD